MRIALLIHHNVFVLSRLVLILVVLLIWVFRVFYGISLLLNFRQKFTNFLSFLPLFCSLINFLISRSSLLLCLCLFCKKLVRKFGECYEFIGVRNFPKDLLQRFMNGGNDFDAQEASEETEEIELSLSLGLSLNGRFGADPTTRANNNIHELTRSSSIPDFVNPFVRDQNDTSFVVPMDCANLIRTCSLPTETEEEWRKRKELQTLRRMQAKRKRTEKQRHLKITARDRISRVSVSGEEVNGVVNQMETHCGVQSQSLVNGVTTKGACASANVLKGGGSAVYAGFLPPASQASNGSSLATGGSSGISELDSQPPQGSHKCIEAVSPSIIQSMQPPRNTEVAMSEKSSEFMAVESYCNKPTVAKKEVKEAVRNVLEDMPCVSTTGDGPDGKRVEGFLYRYRKGEEVRIVCVCHGSFLSPAEFVMHAGGGDVAHPLKHIVVNPFPIL